MQRLHESRGGKTHGNKFRAENSKLPQQLRKVAGLCIYLQGLWFVWPLSGSEAGTSQKESYLTDNLEYQKSKIEYYFLVKGFLLGHNKAEGIMIRIYTKWEDGDHMMRSEAKGWGGAKATLLEQAALVE